MVNIFQKTQNKEAVAVYYIGTFLMDFAMALTFAIYVIFLLRSGLDVLQANLINFVFMISVFLLEVPTGAFADFLGRKKSVLIALVFLALGCFLYPTFRTYQNFILAEILVSFYAAFSSGAFDAWVVDTAKKQGFEGKVDFVFSQANIISKAAMILGGLVGAYLANFEIGLPFYAGGLVAVMAFFFLLFFMEGQPTEKRKFTWQENISKIKNIAVDSINYSAKHKVIFWLVFGGVLSSFIWQPLNMFWGPRFNNMAGDQIWLTGWMWAIMSLFMMFGAYLVRFSLKKGKNYTFLMVLVSVGVFLPIMLSAATHLLFIAFPAFLVYELARGVEKPVQQAYVNQYAEPEKRATILSFESMMSSLGAAGGLVFFGWIAKHTSIEISWIFSAVLALALIPIYLMARKKEAHYEKNS